MRVFLKSIDDGVAKSFRPPCYINKIHGLKNLCSEIPTGPATGPEQINVEDQFEKYQINPDAHKKVSGDVGKMFDQRQKLLNDLKKMKDFQVQENNCRQSFGQSYGECDRGFNPNLGCFQRASTCENDKTCPNNGKNYRTPEECTNLCARGGLTCARTASCHSDTHNICITGTKIPDQHKIDELFSGD